MLNCATYADFLESCSVLHCFSTIFTGFWQTCLPFSWFSSHFEYKGGGAYVPTRQATDNDLQGYMCEEPLHDTPRLIFES